MEKFCDGQFKTKVLFKDCPEYAKGYDICESYHPKVDFIPEVDFQLQTKKLVSEGNYIAVSTDDTVIYREFSLTERHLDKVDIFSLRYGLNTTVQDEFTNLIQPALTTYSDEGDTISWDIRDYNPLYNYGFPFGHDMHVYSSKYAELVGEANFNKTNQLETWLFNNGRERINPHIRSFKHSVAVNIPGNNTSGVTQTDNSLPLEEINQRFLSGMRFRLDEIESMKVVGCHQTHGLVME